MRYEAMLPFKFRMRNCQQGSEASISLKISRAGIVALPLGRDYGSIFCHGTHHMKTLDLQGNLLNLYVALAMGGFDESSGSWAPFDYWEGTIRYRDQEFSPLTDIATIWPEVLRLRLSTHCDDDGLWSISLPGQSPSAIGAADQPAGESQAFRVADPIHGYCLAIVWNQFGPEVPDVFESSWAGCVPLEHYNVPLDTSVDFDGVVKPLQVQKAAEILRTSPLDASQAGPLMQAAFFLGVQVVQIKPQEPGHRWSIQVGNRADSQILASALTAAGIAAEAASHHAFHAVYFEYGQD